LPHLFRDDNVSELGGKGALPTLRPRPHRSLDLQNLGAELTEQFLDALDGLFSPCACSNK
jgi:hypothetical protein